jgi:hypothetical protein
MSLLFNNVEILGYNHKNNFLGEDSLFYSSTRTISIEGFVLDLANDNGVKGIFNNVNALLNETKNFQNILINGRNFGNGKVKSFSVDSGNWVKYTRYQVDIEVILKVPLSNLDSKEFNNTNLNNRRFELLKNFSESFSLDFDTQNKVLGGEHSIEIEYDADNKSLNLISLAQALASELLKTIPSNPNIAEGNYLTRQNYKSLVNEDYNTITGKCGFRKVFSYSTLNNSSNYSFIRKHSVEINENGIATTIENCTIKAENDEPSLYQNALNGYNQEINNVFNRSNSVFQNYKNKFNIIQNLNTSFVSKNVQVNKFDGVITYTITFDNDPKKINSSYQWEYVRNLDRSSDGVWTASENGSIKGNGKIGLNQKYTNAENGWGVAKNGILGRVGSFYNSEAKDKSGSTLKELSKNIKRNPYEGNIDYDFVYTDDPTIKDGSDMGIRKVNIEKSRTALPPLTKDFIIPNRTYTLNQNRNFTQQGTYSVKVNMEIGCTNNNNSLNSAAYFNKAKSLAGSFNVPGGKDNYLESINYSSDETDKTISYEAIYKYS